MKQSHIGQQLEKRVKYQQYGESVISKWNQLGSTPFFSFLLLLLLLLVALYIITKKKQQTRTKKNLFDKIPTAVLNEKYDIQLSEIAPINKN